LFEIGVGVCSRFYGRFFERDHSGALVLWCLCSAIALSQYKFLKYHHEWKLLGLLANSCTITVEIHPFQTGAHCTGTHFVAAQQQLYLVGNGPAFGFLREDAPLHQTGPQVVPWTPENR
jgi:hypothetical protein